MTVTQSLCLDVVVGVQADRSVLTALVEPVQPVDVIAAHLGGLAQSHVAVGNGHHGGAVVLGEGVSGDDTTQGTGQHVWFERPDAAVHRFDKE